MPWPAGAAASASNDPYSRRVARLKLVLPAIGLGLLLTVTAWPRLAPLFERLRFAWPAIDLREARELRMLNPHYLGTDRNNHPFVLTATVGRQVPDRQDLMALEQPRADMQTRGGATMVLNSNSGVYQSQTQLLDLFGDVTLVHQNGSTFLTSSAHLDMAANAATGHEAVEGHGPSGDVWGEGFEIINKGDTIVFTGQSKLISSTNRSAPVPTAAPPKLPDAVIATAAQAEAQVRPIATASARPKPAPAVAHSASRPAAAHSPAPAATKSKAPVKAAGGKPTARKPN
ncbi:MAG TPA: LPS export ABC transporter periplasmic protein LptC [Stellaceae bacterium]|nr:LPS export ABC transporter periplasmic protein LptC [Stellaceae bacterium]